jgi:hypothetical protein
MTQDQVTPFDRRFWRAQDIPGDEIVTLAVAHWDEETASRFVDASFMCLSQSGSYQVYHGRVTFNGSLEVAECECKDKHSKENEPVLYEGIRVCKHSLAALLKLGFFVD